MLLLFCIFNDLNKGRGIYYVRIFVFFIIIPPIVDWFSKIFFVWKVPFLSQEMFEVY